jgi:hypothetical protein
MDRAAFLAVFALILTAPFEAAEPLVRWFGLSFTNLELAMVGALGVAGLWLGAAREWRRLHTPLTLPGILLVCCLFAAALQAAYPQTALRLTGRFLAGFLVFLAVCAVATRLRRVDALFLAAACSGGLVSLLAVLEAWQVSVVSDYLEAFRGHSYFVGGELRASSTLLYPTVTSMYLEIAYALTLGLFLSRVEQRRRAATGFLFLLLNLTAYGVVLTLSRAGLASLAIISATAAALWICRRGSPRGLKALGAAGAAAALLVGLHIVGDPLFRLRVATDGPAGWYRAEYQVPESLEIQAGQLHTVPVTLTNRGPAAWHPDGRHPFRLSYHWLDFQTERLLVVDGLRTELPSRIHAGESVTVTAQVQAPAVPGNYLLAWDMVQEGRMWFAAAGAPSAHTGVRVLGPVDPDRPRIQPSPSPLPERPPTVERTRLWAQALRMAVENPWLGVGPDNFRMLHDAGEGFDEWSRTVHTNNAHLEFLVGAGIPGGVLFLWLTLGLVGKTWTRSSRVVSAELPYFAGVAGAVAAILAHGLVDYFFPFTPTYVMIWSVFALVCSEWQPEFPAVGAPEVPPEGGPG